MSKPIEITPRLGRICMQQPSRLAVNPLPVNLLTMKIHREGQRAITAIYNAEARPGDQVCFMIDDSLVYAKPGSYIAVIYSCNKPVQNLRLHVPRGILRNPTTIDVLPCGDECEKPAECPPAPGCEDKCIENVCERTCEPVCGCPN